MADVGEIYEALRKSEMNAWVGGDDPEHVGQMCYSQLLRAIPTLTDQTVLDFGCGIGRTLLAALRKDPDLDITGFDIMPPVIDFCRREIATRFPNAKFELVAETNDHYDRLAANAQGKARDKIIAEYGGRFDVAYAFSVFTHIAPGDFQSLLEFVGRTLKPGGNFYFTCFMLTPYTRERIATGGCAFTFDRPQFQNDGKVFVGDADDPLAFIAYDIDLMLKMIQDAGLFVFSMEFGAWSGGGLAWSLQDVIVLRKAGDGVDPRLKALAGRSR